MKTQVSIVRTLIQEIVIRLPPRLTTSSGAFSGRVQTRFLFFLSCRGLSRREGDERGERDKVTPMHHSCWLTLRSTDAASPPGGDRSVFISWLTRRATPQLATFREESAAGSNPSSSPGASRDREERRKTKRSTPTQIRSEWFKDWNYPFRPFFCIPFPGSPDLFCFLLKNYIKTYVLRRLLKKSWKILQWSPLKGIHIHMLRVERYTIH